MMIQNCGLYMKLLDDVICNATIYKHRASDCLIVSMNKIAEKIEIFIWKQHMVNILFSYSFVCMFIFYLFSFTCSSKISL